MINQNDMKKLENVKEFIDKYSNEFYNSKSATLCVSIMLSDIDEELFKRLVKEDNLKVFDMGSNVRAEGNGIVISFWPRYTEKINPEVNRILSELENKDVG